MTERVYQYGLRAPIEGRETIHEQLHLAWEYRRTLTILERGRRGAIRMLYRSDPEVSACEAALRAAIDDTSRAAEVVCAERAAARTRSAASEEALAALKTSRQIERECRAKVWEARKRWAGESAFQVERERINNLAYGVKIPGKRIREGGILRQARAQNGLYWGTYLQVEAAMDASRKAPLWGDDALEPNDPRWPRWTGEGTVAVQIIHGMFVDELDGDDTRVRVLPGIVLNEHQKLLPTRRVLCLRVKSDKHKPIWASWPLNLHRPLPPGGRVKWVAVNLRLVAGHERWTADVTVDTTACATPAECGAGCGTVAIDLGWRLLEDGSLRVCRWRDDSDESGELTLTPEQLSHLTEAEGLRSIRDRHLSYVRPYIADWLASHPIPDWLRERTATLAQWRSQARVAALAIAWRNARFDGDAWIFTGIEWWRQVDKHLWLWEVGSRAHAIRARRDVYRCFAARIARTYDTIVLEDFCISGVARKPKLEEVDGENSHAASQRVLAASSHLRLAIVNAAGRLRRNVAKYDSAWTTQTCHACGSVEHFDAAAELEHVCGNCSAILRAPATAWDQDDNACRNLLARHRERGGGAKTPAPARTKKGPRKTARPGESKWARLAREKAERETARNAECKAAE